MTRRQLFIEVFRAAHKIIKESKPMPHEAWSDLQYLAIWLNDRCYSDHVVVEYYKENNILVIHPLDSKDITPRVWNWSLVFSQLSEEAQQQVTELIRFR